MLYILFIMTYCLFHTNSNSFLQASSIGDNAGIIGNAAGLQHDEGNEDSLESEGDDTSSEGDSIWPSDGNSSPDVDEEVYKDLENLFGKENPTSSEGDSMWPSDGNSSPDVDEEVYEELYQCWDDLFEKENPVIKGMKILVESTRKTTKILKKVILLGTYHDSNFCKQPRRIPVETGIEWVKRTLHNPNACYNMFRMLMSLSCYLRSWSTNMG